MAKTDTYSEAVGRRKTATARVRITPAKQEKILVNERTLSDYFRSDEEAEAARAALKEVGGRFSITTKVTGGGLKAQAGAIRHGIARALVKHDAELRKTLKKGGFLRRDSRMKERKKFGLKGARRAPQWSKR